MCREQTHEEALHRASFDDIKEALEILISQHMSMIEHIATQESRRPAKDLNHNDIQRCWWTSANYGAPN
ncbi:hypothetical protein HAX54_003605, partial [Datura stramonium]|nr:hypothetical protein [Datura stramonium]